jgi:hypothetical protein
MKNRNIIIEKYIEPSEVMVGGNDIAELWFNKYGEEHSFLDYPSIIGYSSGQIIFKYWHKKGEIHRDRGLPSVIYYENDIITEKAWYKNGEFIKRERF